MEDTFEARKGTPTHRPRDHPQYLLQHAWLKYLGNRSPDEDKPALAHWRFYEGGVVKGV